ncbi:MAG: porin family protein [Holophagaceae bacterium]|nr:porin family protein [Holophagaceae bacterium]
MTHHRFSLAAMVLALAGGAVSAQDVHFGLHAGLAIPQGDLSRKQLLGSDPGGNFGAHVNFDMKQGHVIRIRTDYSQFRENKTFEGYGFTSKIKASDLSLGVDYLYFVDHRPTGLYMMAGVSGNRWDLSSKDDYGYAIDTFNMTTTKFGYGFGVGYQFNQSWGLEAGYTYSKIGSSDFPINADVLRLTATIRF